MATRKEVPKITPFPASSGKETDVVRAAAKSRELIRQFMWSIASLDAHLEEIHQFWARRLGVTDPQWLILMAVNDLDKGAGVSGSDITAKLHTHPASVTNQTKVLETSGLLRRTVSAADARFVMMFLTDKARKEIDKLTALRDQINGTLFASLDNNQLKDITEKLLHIDADAKKVASRLSIEI